MANVHVLTLHGEIDISQKQWIEQELSQIESFGPSATTILDLSDVRYLDTTFLNALCRLQERLHEEQPESALCVVTARNDFVSRLFRLTHLDRIFRLFDDMSSARRASRVAAKYSPLRSRRAPWSTPPSRGSNLIRTSFCSPNGIRLSSRRA